MSYGCIVLLHESSGILKHRLTSDIAWKCRFWFWGSFFCLHVASCDEIICAVHDVLIKGGVLVSRVVLWHIFLCTVAGNMHGEHQVKLKMVSFEHFCCPTFHPWQLSSSYHFNMVCNTAAVSSTSLLPQRVSFRLIFWCRELVFFFIFICGAVCQSLL